MPQMSPLSWLILFMVFTLSYLGFLTMNYFSTFYSSKTPSQININSTSHSWKW
uniref:ATP synthase complex subunit 8 n=1 Tax=Parajapyx emeryanus TaxID=165473 RepID=U3KTN0_9HEXA|nr:ATP synthase F0 subunit 8 [Parajapyx emeryanus]AEV44850.1 ATP synthase F0 subunit 8 [Parajapyx emeryanus]